MNRQEVLKFINENPMCHMATLDGNQPRVRGMGMFKADEKGPVFQISKVKAMYEQLKKDPHLELCFNSPGTQVRVAGVAEFVDDRELKSEIVAKRPFLKPLMEKLGEEVVVVFRVVKCKVSVWTMATNLEPTTWVDW